MSEGFAVDGEVVVGFVTAVVLVVVVAIIVLVVRPVVLTKIGVVVVRSVVDEAGARVEVRVTTSEAVRLIVVLVPGRHCEYQSLVIDERVTPYLIVERLTCYIYKSIH